MLKSVLTLLLFYSINFLLWDVFVDRGILTPQYASFTVYSILFLIMIILHGKSLKRQWVDFRRKTPSGKTFLIRLILWSLVGALLSGVFIFIFGNLLNIDVLPKNQENVNEMVDRFPAILSILMMGIYAPLIEETVFRHSIVGLAPKGQKGFTLVLSLISIILFDLIHVIRLPEFLYYLPMSVLLTGFYLVHNKNVWASVFFHAFFNIGGYLLIALGLFEG